MTKFGRDLTELSCKRTQVGTETLPDGSIEPIFRIEPYVPLAYRQLIEIVTNQHPTADFEG